MLGACVTLGEEARAGAANPSAAAPSPIATAVFVMVGNNAPPPCGSLPCTAHGGLESLGRQLIQLSIISQMDVLITAEELRDADVVLLDVRWDLNDPHGRRHYDEGHIPGAVFVDLETELSGPPSPQAGRHPLPDMDDLQAAARRWGIDDGDAVVLYDATGNLAAARGWWLLRYAGLSDVRLLDGGLQAWTGELSTEAPAVEPGTVTLHPGALPVLDADGAAALARTGVLLDARAPERYRGEVEPLDPRAGHIPGARNAPTRETLGPDGRFLSAEELRARFGDFENVGTYCGSGVTAAHLLAALAIAGVEGALYPGSWSQWSSDPSRPAEQSALT
jgi:thiosulfate/3-mercaptopyruvate sulfurtransferase